MERERRNLIKKQLKLKEFNEIKHFLRIAHYFSAIITIFSQVLGSNTVGPQSIVN